MAVVGLYSTFNVPGYYEGGQSLVNTTQEPLVQVTARRPRRVFHLSKLGGTQTRFEQTQPQVLSALRRQPCFRMCRKRYCVRTGVCSQKTTMPCGRSWALT